MILSIFSSVCVVFFPIRVFYFWSVFKSAHFHLVGLFVSLLFKVLGVFCVQAFYQIDDMWWFSLNLWIVFELCLLKISTELVLLYYSVGEYPFRVDLTCLYFLNVVIYKFISIIFSFFSNFSHFFVWVVFNLCIFLCSLELLHSVNFLLALKWKKSIYDFYARWISSGHHVMPLDLEQSPLRHMGLFFFFFNMVFF